jgi:hypothetical protein
MGTVQTFRHTNYALQCSAKALDNGWFAPVLVVTKQVWPSRPRTIAVSCGDCLSEENAIEAAHAQGIEWIQNYG